MPPTSWEEVLLTETVLWWRDTVAGQTDADLPPAMGDDAHTRDGGGYVAGVATDERLGQHPRAEAAAADTRTPASGQGVNLKVQSSRIMEAITASYTTTETGKATMPTSSCPSSENGLLKQAKRMPARAYKLARHLHSCCFTLIHSIARLLCEERSLFSQANTHKVSHSRSVITSCQQRRFVDGKW